MAAAEIAPPAHNGRGGEGGSDTKHLGRDFVPSTVHYLGCTDLQATLFATLLLGYFPTFRTTEDKSLQFNHQTFSLLLIFSSPFTLNNSLVLGADHDLFTLPYQPHIHPPSTLGHHHHLRFHLPIYLLNHATGNEHFAADPFVACNRLVILELLSSEVQFPRDTHTDDPSEITTTKGRDYQALGNLYIISVLNRILLLHTRRKDFTDWLALLIPLQVGGERVRESVRLGVCRPVMINDRGTQIVYTWVGGRQMLELLPFVRG